MQKGWVGLPYGQAAQGREKQCLTGEESALLGVATQSSSGPMDSAPASDNRDPLFSNLSGTAEGSEVINNIIKELTTNPLYVKLTQILNSN